MVKNPYAMLEKEMWVQSLSREDPLEGEMATHSNILAWRIPWTEEPGGLQSMGSQRLGHDRSNLTHTHTKAHRREKGIGMDILNCSKCFCVKPSCLELLIDPALGYIMI